MAEQNTPRYPYVHVDVPPEDTDLASLCLFELGALGVEERDESTFTRGDSQTGINLRQSADSAFGR